jgi:hypothetical protein
VRLRSLFLAALVGCATLPAGDLPRADVVVTNQHWLDQVVYANCGVPVRLGVAGGLRTTTLRLPSPCLDRVVSFTVDPIGSNLISRSDGLSVVAGETLALQIPAYTNGYIFLSR